MKQHGKTIVPRNPVAPIARRRKAGAHDKTYKVKRRDNKQKLKQTLRILDKKGDEVAFFILLPL
ncbi:MAG: hypothetical protein LBS40_04230 [Burkholderiales bacterium]|jgi:hypothetical protein|nr:hypothetical protein [Burkholderiales bacterium]